MKSSSTCLGKQDIQDVIRRQRDRFMKPHITRHGAAWCCYAQGVQGEGASPKAAFTSWQTRRNQPPRQMFKSPPSPWPYFNPDLLPFYGRTLDLVPPYVVTCGLHA